VNRCSHVAHMGMPVHPGYACTPAGLCRGLDGTLSAMSVRPAGKAVRGFVVELLVTGGSRAVANDDGMPRRTAADAMAQGGRRTHGRPCGTGW
jgi:hypothetical protein